MKSTIGFDPGKEGGFCAITSSGEAHEIVVAAFHFNGLELDTNQLWHWCKQINSYYSFNIPTIVIEKVHAMPGQGVTSMFTFGSGYGELKALAKILAWPTIIVTPQEWKKHVLAGTDKSKGATVEWALRTYPSLQPQLLKKSGLAHMGKVDALAIAHYGHHFAKR